MSHILILEGDGYLGWPTAMYFSNRGYQVTVVDNAFRRNASKELDAGLPETVIHYAERPSARYSLMGYKHADVTLSPTPVRRRKSTTTTLPTKGVQDIGVEPHYLTEEVMDRLFEVVEQYRGNTREEVVSKGVGGDKECWLFSQTGQAISVKHQSRCADF